MGIIDTNCQGELIGGWLMIIGLKITEEGRKQKEGFAMSVGCRSCFSRDLGAFSYRWSHSSHLNEVAKKI